MPILKATDGAGRTRTFRWRERSVTIGRHPANDLVLDDDAVSRWHAAIFRVGGEGWRLRDLGSRHGLTVGDRPRRKADLRDGDRLRVGASRLVFHSGAGPEDLVLVEEGEATELDGAADASVGSAVASAASGGERFLEILVDGMEDLTHSLHPDGVLSSLADSVARIARPSVCLAGLVDEGGRLDPRARRPEDDGPQAVSRTLVERAISTARAVCWEVGAGPDAAGESAHALGIHMAVGLPLRAQGRVQGLLYADWRAGAAPPDPNLIESMRALALSAGAALENALRHRRLRAERERMAEALQGGTQLLGVSRATRDLVELVDRCAPRDIDVLVVGETGTGKELVARRLHERSSRREGPFVPVNCAAIPRELFESELFGHAKGAFTHAVGARTGLLEQASGGTVFLDEIAEIEPGLQAKLLRVVEERRVAPVGGKPRDLDLRIVAATNRDPEEAVAGGGLRRDLLHRLGVRVATEPLRERREDIRILAYWFLDRLGPEMEREVDLFSGEAMERLEAHDWPGNVRQLRNAVRNALLLCSDRIEPEHLRLTPGLEERGPEDLPSLEEVERRHLVRVLEATGGNQARAARILGVKPDTVKAMMERHGLDRSEFSG